MSLNISIAGITGKVGKALAEEVVSKNELNLISGISQSNTTLKFNNVSVPSFDTITQLLAHSVPDVLIDYSSPLIVKKQVLKAIENGVHVVIGTSGLSNDDYDEIHEAALKYNVGVVAGGNFSITATLLRVFAKKAMKYLPYYEVFDYAGSKKMDAPNGTSREIASELAKIQEPKYDIAIKDTLGLKESRGASINNVQVHAIRIPSFYSSNEILLGSEFERLQIRQDTVASPIPYVYGTLEAAKKVVDLKGLVRGLENVIEI